jgi:hypothetical protein
MGWNMLNVLFLVLFIANYMSSPPFADHFPPGQDSCAFKKGSGPESSLARTVPPNPSLLVLCPRPFTGF